MLIAKELRKQNIAEYLIYIFQLEDLVRAYKGNVEKIFEQYVRHFQVDAERMNEIKRWYETLCKMMSEENLFEKGHLQFLRHKMEELENLHWQLMTSAEQDNYKFAFEQCKDDLEVFKVKSQMTEHGYVEPALTALYSILLMRLKKMHISDDTLQAIDRISKWISILAKYYHELENGKLRFQ